jgi:hypothetical protein
MEIIIGNIPKKRIVKEHDCKVCGTKDVEKFYPTMKSKCKKCQSIASRDKYRNKSVEDKKKSIAYAVKWQNDNFIKCKVDQCKRRSKKKGFEFNITEDYILRMYKAQNYRCKLSGVKMPLEVGNYRGAMSIDRIDPSIGYVKGNIQLLCAAVNRMKADLNQKEFIRLINIMSNHLR